MSGSEQREPVVLLHGFTQTGRSWDGVIDSLPGQRYRALAPDLRGHGAATAATPVTIAACVADIAALAPPRFTLAGYSMGGRIALAFALAQPERVRRLVLVSATAGIEDAGERRRRRERDAALAGELERDGLQRFAQRWGRQPLFAGQSDAVRARAHEDRMRNEAAGLAAALRGIGTGTMAPLWDRLSELAMPAVVLAGEQDERYVALGRRLAASLPAARLELVAGAGHALTLERPDVVADAITGRLSQA